MTLKYKILLGVVSFAVAFACGRYSVQSPSVKTKVDSLTSTNTVGDTDTHKETTTVTEKEPGGKVKTTTKIVEDTTSEKKSESNTTTHIEQTVTPPKLNTVNISALAGIDFISYQPVYGASVTKQILGPISIGAFILTNRSVGLSLGVSF